jgi:hypothetical protein
MLIERVVDEIVEMVKREADGNTVNIAVHEPMTMILVPFTHMVAKRFRPKEIPGAQWVGNSSRHYPDQAVLEYQGLQQWRACGYCLFAVPFRVDDIRWAIYSEIQEGIRETGVHL